MAQAALRIQTKEKDFTEAPEFVQSYLQSYKARKADSGRTIVFYGP